MICTVHDWLNNRSTPAFEFLTENHTNLKKKQEDSRFLQMEQITLKVFLEARI